MSLTAINPVKIWRAINWQALIVLMMFLLSWSAAPASLLAYEPDFCSMECCVAEGHCCCTARKAFVEGQDHSQFQEFGQAAVEASCPCPVTPPSSAKIVSRQTVRTSTYLATIDSRPPPVRLNFESLYQSLRFRPESSRAPPALS